MYSPIRLVSGVLEGGAVICVLDRIGSWGSQQQFYPLEFDYFVSVRPTDYLLYDSQLTTVGSSVWKSEF